jgi:hypothetical protein
MGNVAAWSRERGVALCRIFAFTFTLLGHLGEVELPEQLRVARTEFVLKYIMKRNFIQIYATKIF